jgi:predicted nucleic acid-binding protein
MKKKVFVDTNIFVCAALLNERDYLKREKFINVLRTKYVDFIVSIQVINEFYITLLKNNIPEALIRERIDEISIDAMIIDITMETIKNAWVLRDKYKYSYWDSLIIASANESGCSILFSEDMQQGQVIENKLKIQNPFK